MCTSDRSIARRHTHTHTQTRSHTHTHTHTHIHTINTHTHTHNQHTLTHSCGTCTRGGEEVIVTNCSRGSACQKPQLARTGRNRQGAARSVRVTWPPRVHHDTRCGHGVFVCVCVGGGGDDLFERGPGYINSNPENP